RRTSRRADRPKAGAQGRSQRRNPDLTQLGHRVPAHPVAFFFRRVSTMALRVDDPFLASPPLPHEKLRTAVTARRVALLKLGYEPIRVLSGRKRPAMNGWQEARITIPPNEDVITPWADTYPGALSTGIRTRYTPGFDIDIKDQNVADQV